ncbi:SUKH-3 domain-containing protein [Promicromonospora sukumoe]
MFDDATVATLTQAGWIPERSISIDPWAAQLWDEGVEVHAAAAAFLAEFGGLTVEHRGPGISRARESFAIDPEECVGECDRFLEWSQDLGRQIVPVGSLSDGRFFLGLDEGSELYLVEAFVKTFGPMPVAMDRLVLGVMPEAVDETVTER